MRHLHSPVKSLKLFGLTQEDTVTINYFDKDGDIIRLSSDGELQTALKHLGEDDTWKLQVTVSHKQPAMEVHNPHMQVYQPAQFFMVGLEPISHAPQCSRAAPRRSGG